MGVDEGKRLGAGLKSLIDETIKEPINVKSLIAETVSEAEYASTMNKPQGTEGGMDAETLFNARLTKDASTMDYRTALKEGRVPTKDVMRGGMGVVTTERVPISEQEWMQQGNAPERVKAQQALNETIKEYVGTRMPEYQKKLKELAKEARVNTVDIRPMLALMAPCMGAVPISMQGAISACMGAVPTSMQPAPTKESQKRASEARQQHAALKTAIQKLKELDKVANLDPTGDKLHSIGRAFADQDLYNLFSFGLKQMSEDITTVNAYNRAAKGEATEEDMALIETIEAIKTIEGAKDKPLTYKIFNATLQSLPYMAEIAMFGGLRTGVITGLRQVLKKAAPKALKQVMKPKTVGSVVQTAAKLGAKATAGVAGTAAVGSIMPMTAVNTLENALGNFQVKEVDGEFSVDKVDDERAAIKDFTKAVMQTTATLYAEESGKWMGDALGGAGRLALKSTKVRKVIPDFIQEMTKTPKTAGLMKSVKVKTMFDGPFEIGEEYVEKIFHSFIPDSPLNEAERAEVNEYRASLGLEPMGREPIFGGWDEFIIISGSVLLTMGLMGTPKKIGQGYDFFTQYQEGRRVKEMEKYLPDNIKSDLVSAMNQQTLEERQEALKGIDMSNLSPEDKRTVASYMGRKTIYDALKGKAIHDERSLAMARIEAATREYTFDQKQADGTTRKMVGFGQIMQDDTPVDFIRVGEKGNNMVVQPMMRTEEGLVALPRVIIPKDKVENYEEIDADVWTQEQVNEVFATIEALADEAEAEETNETVARTSTTPIQPFYPTEEGGIEVEVMSDGRVRLKFELDGELMVETMPESQARARIETLSPGAFTDIQEAPIEEAGVPVEQSQTEGQLPQAQEPVMDEEDIEQKNIIDAGAILTGIETGQPVKIEDPQAVAELKERPEFHVKENKDGSVNVVGIKNEDGSWNGEAPTYPLNFGGKKLGVVKELGNDVFQVDEPDLDKGKVDKKVKSLNDTFKGRFMFSVEEGMSEADPTNKFDVPAPTYTIIGREVPAQQPVPIPEQPVPISESAEDDVAENAEVPVQQPPVEDTIEQAPIEESVEEPVGEPAPDAIQQPPMEEPNAESVPAEDVAVKEEPMVEQVEPQRKTEGLVKVGGYSFDGLSPVEQTEVLISPFRIGIRGEIPHNESSDVMAILTKNKGKWNTDMDEYVDNGWYHIHTLMNGSFILYSPANDEGVVLNHKRQANLITLADNFVTNNSRDENNTGEAEILERASESDSEVVVAAAVKRGTEVGVALSIYSEQDPRDIATDEKRFQNRFGLDEGHVQKIMAEWEHYQQDAIDIWIDPKDGKMYVLSGHHRLEAAKRLGVNIIVARDQSHRTEEDAIEFAKDKANANRRMETPLERAMRLQEKRQEGLSAKEEKAFLAMEGKNRNQIRSLSYLWRGGKTFEALKAFSHSGESDTSKEIFQRAEWIGNVRSRLAVTDAHENEMFEFLMDATASDRIKTQTDFYELVERYFKPLEPNTRLNLKRIKSLSYSEKEFNRMIGELEKKKKGVQDKIDVLNARFTDTSRKDYISTSNPEHKKLRQIADDKISELNAIRNAYQKDIEALRLRGEEFRGEETGLLFSTTGGMEGESGTTTTAPFYLKDHQKKIQRAQAIQKEHPNALPVFIGEEAEIANRLPQWVKGAKAATDGKWIYINLNRIKDEKEVIMAWLHEQLGHGALWRILTPQQRKKFGEDTHGLFKRWAKSDPDISGIYEEVMRVHKNDTKAIQGEEMFARYVAFYDINAPTTPPQMNLASKIIQYIEDIIRKLFTGTKLTKNELDDMVRRVFVEVREGHKIEADGVERNTPSELVYNIGKYFEQLLSGLSKSSKFLKDNGFGNLRFSMDGEFRSLEDKTKMYKKAFGESAAKAIRSYMPIAFDHENQLIDYLTNRIPIKSHRAHIIKSIGDRIEKDFLRSLEGGGAETKKEKSSLTPSELLKTVGYSFTNTPTGKDVMKFRMYYPEGGRIGGSVICTYNDPDGRARNNFVSFIVKDDAEQTLPAGRLTQENLSPSWKKYLEEQGRKNEDGTYNLDGLKNHREDPFSTSVLSIQISKNGLSVKIISRYNHTIETGNTNPDATFGSNLDNIAEGLSAGMANYFGVKLDGKREEPLPDDIRRHEDRYFHVQREVGGVEYGDGFYIQDGIAHILDSNKERMVDGAVISADGSIEFLTDSNLPFYTSNIEGVEFIKNGIIVKTPLGRATLTTDGAKVVKLGDVSKELRYNLLENIFRAKTTDEGIVINYPVYHANIVYFDGLFGDDITGITKTADFRGSQLTSLGALTSIGDDANFGNSQLTSLGSLQSIGGSAYFRNSQLTSLGSLQSIGVDANFGNSQLTSLGSLQSIGGSAYFSNSRLTSLGSLQSIGGSAYFGNSQLTSLGSLQSIGGSADFSDSWLTSLGSLQSIGGSAYFGIPGNKKLRAEYVQIKANMPEVRFSTDQAPEIDKEAVTQDILDGNTIPMRFPKGKVPDILEGRYQRESGRDVVLNVTATERAHILALEAAGIPTIQGIDDNMRTIARFAEMSSGDKTMEYLADKTHRILDFQELIKSRGGTVVDENNVHWLMNQASSRAQDAMTRYQKGIIDPIHDTMMKLRKKGITFGDVDIYLMAKHIPERNSYFRDKRAKDIAEEMEKLRDVTTKPRADTMSEREYANILKRFEKLNEEGKTLAEADFAGEREFTQYVGMTPEQYLEQDYIKNEPLLTLLSKQVKKHADFVLDYGYEGRLMSEEVYNDLKNRWEHYVPLRGWNEALNETEVQLEYQNTGFKGAATGLLKSAKGRTTLADSPIVYLQSIGENTIHAAEKGRYMQGLLNLVIENKDVLKDLVMVKGLWAIHQEATDTWNIAPLDYVPTEEDKREGKAKRTHHIEPSKRPTMLDDQRQVRVNRSGREYVIVFGEKLQQLALDVPRQAKALNVSEYSYFEPKYWMGRVTRFMAQNFTAKSPPFAIMNGFRDYLYSNTRHIAQYGVKYAAQYNKNYALSQGAVWRAAFDKLNPDKDTDRMMMDFLRLGGATGQSFQQGIDQIRKSLTSLEEKSKPWTERKGKTLAKQAGSWFVSPIVKLGDVFESFTQASELMARFATYKTSIEMGKSPVRAIRDAKEVTTNFNTRGSDKLFSVMFGFFNASIQGMRNTAGLAYQFPKAMLTVASSYYALGIIQGMCMDDDDDYRALNPYLKSTNLYFRAGERLIGIPMPHVIRIFYNAGIQTHRWMEKDITLGRAVFESGMFASDEMIPEGLNAMRALVKWDNASDNVSIQKAEAMVGQFIPTSISPIYELFINENFFGSRIVNRPFDKDSPIPKFMRYKRNVNPLAKELTDFIAIDIGGYDPFTKNVSYLEDGQVKRGNPLLDYNPSAIEHLVSTYFGGRGQFYVDMIATAKGISDKIYGEETDWDWTQAPVLNRVIRNPSQDSYQYNEIYRIKDKVDAAMKVIRDTQKSEGAPEEVKNRNVLRVQEYMQTEDYKAKAEAERLIKDWVRYNELATQFFMEGDKEVSEDMERKKKELLSQIQALEKKMK